MQKIKRRQDFLEAARSRCWALEGVVVQSRSRQDQGPARIGFTVTRKLGSAVVRNRIRRRLKEAVRLYGPSGLKPGTDYVFIGRQASAQRPFPMLMADISLAIEALNNGQGAPRHRNRVPRR